MTKPLKRKVSKAYTASVLRAVIFAFLLTASLAVGFYPSISQWWNSYLQSQQLEESQAIIDRGPQEKFDQIRKEAEKFNARMNSGVEVTLKEYFEQVNPFGTNQMGRIKIPVINVDIPIYHTSSDEVLKKGAGHMPETSLPVGGKGNHAAITAHRGLAESKLFTDLDKVKVGDQFTLEVLGIPQVYEVREVRIVKPDEIDWLKRQAGRDLVTLITCDPLGINTERILVMGERVTPTPEEAIEDLGKGDADVPGFPWVVIYFGIGLTVIIILAKRSMPNKELKYNEEIK